MPPAGLSHAPTAAGCSIRQQHLAHGARIAGNVGRAAKHRIMRRIEHDQLAAEVAVGDGHGATGRDTWGRYGNDELTGRLIRGQRNDGTDG